jgi:Secreted/periplasmic Zn-dependent peptidases, insulinase-like
MEQYNIMQFITDRNSNEHMLFLGTRKYPETNSFENFLSANGGSSNAFTDSENTVYYFDMAADDDAKLRQGLDRFGSFFSCPLFTESSTLKELNAIESEHAKNLQSDIFRLYQIEKSRANSQHPYSKFYTGNKATLLENTKRYKIDLRTELIKFWSTYYSADQMAIAVVAPQPIALLKDMVVSALEDVPVNGDRLGIKPEEDWVEKIPPFFPGGLGGSVIPARNSWVQVVPVADIRQLILTWPIVYESVQDKECQFLNKPAYYVSHLLGHEGPASLLSYLKKQGWANGVGASTDADLSDFYTLQMSVQLTQKGLEHVEDVVEAIFSSIRMLREDPWPRYILDEVLQIRYVM